MSRRSKRESKKVIYEDFVEGDELDDQPTSTKRKTSGRRSTKSAEYKDLSDSDEEFRELLPEPARTPTRGRKKRGGAARGRRKSRTSESIGSDEKDSDSDFEAPKRGRGRGRGAGGGSRRSARQKAASQEETSELDASVEESNVGESSQGGDQSPVESAQGADNSGGDSMREEEGVEEPEAEREEIESEKQAEEIKQKVEAERIAEQERQRLEAEQLAEEERQRMEAEKLAEDERQRMEAERNAELERQRIEAEKIAEEERPKVEAEKNAEQEGQRVEAERLAEEQRQRLEAERNAELERQKVETERLVEEERQRTEAESIAEQEGSEVEAQRDTEMDVDHQPDAEVKPNADAGVLTEEEAARQAAVEAESERQANLSASITARIEAEKEEVKSGVIVANGSHHIDHVAVEESKELKEQEEVRQSQSFDSQSFDFATSKSQGGGEKKKKKRKKRGQRIREMKEEVQSKMSGPTSATAMGVEIDWRTEGLEKTNPTYYIFNKIFEKFKLPDPVESAPVEESLEPESAKDAAKAPEPKPAPLDDDKDEADDEKEEEDGNKISRKKLRKMNRLTVAELKQLVARPELVEMHDVTARDPRLLLHLKASRNTVQVPRHWCFKRKYLQGKRGIEKPPFDLPDFIKKTGIMEMRETVQNQETQKTLKAQMRERVRPKLGKMDIDYQKLHDAFFRWQTKPKTTIHGDLYYEGKEFETKLREKKPGRISDELRTALGMPTNTDKIPPPWLIAMQRYGPPPSYPNLKIPGLNAPIPSECAFGYHPGGWGKPPVNEKGQPLYGDVFGTDYQGYRKDDELDPTDVVLWGALESESESESEEEKEEEKEDESGIITPAEGLETPSGLQTVSAGLETPDIIELRKTKESGLESSTEAGPALYTILPQKQVEVGEGMMGTQHVYDVTAAIKVPGPVGNEAAAVAAASSSSSSVSAASAPSGEASQKKRKLKEQQDAAKAKKYKEFKF